MNETDFNIMCAKLDGKSIYEHNGKFLEEILVNGNRVSAEKIHNYYSDLNYLMPLAFKLGLLLDIPNEYTSYDEWLDDIRQGLIEIAKEKGTV